MLQWTPRSLSIVVPVYNEADNLERLVDEIQGAVRPLALPFEILIVDDGSRDGSLEALRNLGASTPELVVISLRRNFGQTLALQAGLDRARGDAIITMDGDLQNDPRDIPLLLRELEQGADVVSGWRRRRRDALIRRRVPSWAANWLARRLTGVTIHDLGCALKAYRREVLQRLELYADMHRFVAIMTMPLGASIVEVEVRHRARTAGSSSYGLSRSFSVLADLFVLQMLTRFREHPLRWFGLVGSPFLALMLIALAYAPFAETSGPVLAAVLLLAATTFSGCVLFGLLGELIVETAGLRTARRVLCREWTS